MVGFYVLLVVNLFIWNMYPVPVVQEIGKYGKIPVLVFYFLHQFLVAKFNKREVFCIADRGVARLFFALVASMIVTSLLSRHRAESAVAFAMFLLQILFIYHVAQTAVSREGSVVNAIATLSGLVLCAIMLNVLVGVALSVAFQIDLWEYEWTGDYLRRGFAGYIGDRNVFGHVSAVGFVTALLQYRYRREGYYGYFILFLLLPVFLTFTLLSNTRGTILYLLVFVTLLHFLKYGKANAMSFRKLALAGISILVLSGIFYYASGIRNAVGIALLNKLSSGRILFWGLAIATYLETNIVWGTGFKVIGIDILSQYKDLTSYFQKVEVLSLHSSYVEILTSGGLVWLVVFSFLLVRMFRESEGAVRALFVATLVIAIFESILLIPNNMISFIFWLFCSTVIIGQRPGSPAIISGLRNGRIGTT